MLLLREWSIASDPSGRGKLMPTLLLDFTLCTFFSFASLYLYPFSAINHNLEHDNYVSSVAPLANHQAWGWSQNPWHIQQHILSTYHMPNTVLNTQDSRGSKERQWPLPSWSSELGYVLGLSEVMALYVHFLLTIQLHKQKAASRRPWYGRLSKVWWWCLNSGSYLNARNYLSWKTPRNEISPLFILLLVQPEHLVKVRLWVFLSLSFLACNTGWRPVRVHNLLQLLIRSFLPGRVPMGNIYATFKNSPRGFFYWEIHPNLKGQCRNFQQQWSHPDPKGPRSSGSQNTEGNTVTWNTPPWAHGGQDCAAQPTEYGARTSLLPDPPHLLSWGFPSDQSNRRDKLASPLVNFQRSPSRGGREERRLKGGPVETETRSQAWDTMEPEDRKLCNCA